MEIIKNIFDQHPIVYLQVVTAIVGTTQYKKFRGTILQYFIWAFWYYTLQEFVAIPYARSPLGDGYNKIIYNIYNVVNFLLLYAIFYTYIRNKGFRLLIRIFIRTYLVSLFIELVILKADYHKTAQEYPYILAATGIFVCILYYFYEVMRSEKIIHVHRKFVFWIGVGYFFYYLAMIPLRVGFNEIAISDNPWQLRQIALTMTVVLNISLIIGFLWSGKED